MGKTEIEDYYAAQVLEKYRVTPKGFIDLKALMGDASDNIPGVPKIGEKTAADLMETFGSLEEIYAHVEEISKKSVRESLIENRHLADLAPVDVFKLMLKESEITGEAADQLLAAFNEIETATREDEK